MPSSKRPDPPSAAPDNALVSLVLPTCNGSRYIQQSLRSVLTQTYQHWQLIIVDDGSNDATPDICQKLAAQEPRITIATNPSNLGLPASLNRGFSMARGSLLTWISDDNILAPHFLSSFVQAFNEDASLEFAYSPYYIIDANGTNLGINRASIRCSVEDLGHVNCIGASSMYRSSLAQRVGEYDVDLFLVEDWDYWLRCLTQCRIKRLDPVLVFYRQHPGSPDKQP